MLVFFFKLLFLGSFVEVSGCRYNYCMVKGLFKKSFKIEILGY